MMCDCLRARARVKDSGTEQEEEEPNARGDEITCGRGPCDATDERSAPPHKPPSATRVRMPDVYIRLGVRRLTSNRDRAKE